jgi:hypothetical protein
LSAVPSEEIQLLDGDPQTNKYQKESVPRMAQFVNEAHVATLTAINISGLWLWFGFELGFGKITKNKFNRRKQEHKSNILVSFRSLYSS